MRINKFVAQATGLSRRAADAAISQGRVLINGRAPQMGQEATAADSVTLDGKSVGDLPVTTTVMLHKPAGYVVSRDGQGSKTVYDLLPARLHHLKPVGRLDKDSSGLLLLTNDGQLANLLTHPSHAKQKRYEALLDKPLTDMDMMQLEHGVRVEDYTSRLHLQPLLTDGRHWQVMMSEGRNRQIRRSFQALGYTVTGLHRTNFGDYQLGKLQSGAYETIER